MYFCGIVMFSFCSPKSKSTVASGMIALMSMHSSATGANAFAPSLSSVEKSTP